MDSPKLYLAIDNCFASKRWTEPEEWMTIIRDLGLSYAEASADNECDPLYAGDSALRKWAEKCHLATEKSGVKVANLYSGHGTYATLGLAHTEKEIRDRFLNLWLKPMAKLAAELDAGLGFFCHAFANSILQSPERYRTAERDLYARLAELAAYGKECGCGKLGVEQMYTPHQIPWTLDGAEKLLREVCRQADAPFYLTVDVGHQCGQRKFLNNGASDKSYLFAKEEDGDTCRWLELFGRYSPIIHLQQCDGKSSPHLPFTAKNNSGGIISGEKVLSALAESYRLPEPDGMPSRCEKIFLTLEIFSGTAAINHEILRDLRESVAYWRQFIPEDGIKLKELSYA